MSQVSDLMDLYALSSSERRALRLWISDHVRLTNRVSPTTTYAWKHYAEASLNFYVTNGAFKAAALSCNLMPVNPDAVNWRFRAELYGPLNFRG